MVTTNPLRILVSDDDPAINQLYTTVLPGYGFEVIAVADGDGLATLEFTQRLRPQLLITDRYKPRLDGRRLREALRADRRTAAMAILTISAVDQPAVVDPLTDDLPKPFTLAGLMFRVATLLPLSLAGHNLLVAHALDLPALELRHPVTGLPLLHGFDRILPALTANPDWAALDLMLVAPHIHLRMRGRSGMDHLLAALADLMRRLGGGLMIGHPGFDLRLTALGSADHIAALTPHVQTAIAAFSRRIALRSPYLPLPEFRIRAVDARVGLGLNLLDLRRALS
ncbi:MAG: response regulator [Oscillochloris sp.]|nr:response regulator [Oscillochloris sp.]